LCGVLRRVPPVGAVCTVQSFDVVVPSSGCPATAVPEVSTTVVRNSAGLRKAVAVSQYAVISKIRAFFVAVDRIESTFEFAVSTRPLPAVVKTVMA
jgi:hypothetical protein